MRAFTSFLLCAAALFAGEQTGRRAPGFALPDANMKVYDLADYRGKILILEFMQTDCAHCAEFTPVLDRIQKKYGDKVAILAVANTPHDNASTVGKYAADHEIAYPIVFDQGQMEFTYVRKLTIDNPCVFVIDGNGIIRDDFSYSPSTKDMFEVEGLAGAIDRVLNSNASMAPKK